MVSAIGKKNKSKEEEESKRRKLQIIKFVGEHGPHWGPYASKICWEGRHCPLWHGAGFQAQKTGRQGPEAKACLAGVWDQQRGAGAAARSRRALSAAVRALAPLRVKWGASGWGFRAEEWHDSTCLLQGSLWLCRTRWGRKETKQENCGKSQTRGGGSWHLQWRWGPKAFNAGYILEKARVS